MLANHETRVSSDVKRFVLMFYPDLAREIVEGWGDRLEALRKLTGHTSRGVFMQFCRSLLEAAQGPGIFAETMVRERSAVLYANR